ncbi:hypothetical protein AB0F43_31870 [Kribbella sp. NPDC023972]|uniref:Mom family adenine methylcarbamoylation protein n=1 Tax=Kribbella sp. NPDC023972 TaxID=3154795 RepID=UPI00340AE061
MTATKLPRLLGIDGGTGVTTQTTQRWRDGSPHRVPVSASRFEPSRYAVQELDESTAQAFVCRHHYSSSWPAARLRYGLLDHRADSTIPALVGVMVLGIPMAKKVLTNPFPTLEPYTESLELSRLVLLDEVPGNAESWFCAEAFRMAAARGIRGVVAFADPEPRWRRTATGHEQIKPGHCGIVYQALNFDYLGLGTRRSLVLLPDATALSARAIAKVTGAEPGSHGVVRRLVALGATAPAPGQDPAGWLRAALRDVGAIRAPHRGNHRYALRLGRTRAERTRVLIGLPARSYPKPHPTEKGFSR